MISAFYLNVSCNSQQLEMLRLRLLKGGYACIQFLLTCQMLAVVYQNHVFHKTNRSSATLFPVGMERKR